MEQAARKIEEAQRPENEAVRRELSKNNRIYNNHFFNEREINWEQAERYGLTPEVLRQTGDMEKLLQGRQSGIAYDISMNTELGRSSATRTGRSSSTCTSSVRHRKSGRNTGDINWRRTCWRR